MQERKTLAEKIITAAEAGMNLARVVDVPLDKAGPAEEFDWVGLRPGYTVFFEYEDDTLFASVIDEDAVVLTFRLVTLDEGANYVWRLISKLPANAMKEGIKK